MHKCMYTHACIHTNTNAGVCDCNEIADKLGDCFHLDLQVRSGFVDPNPRYPPQANATSTLRLQA